MGQKLPELNRSINSGEGNQGKPNTTADHAEVSEKLGRAGEAERARRLETEKHLAKAAAHAAAGSKTAAIKEGLSAVKSAGGAKALAGMIGQAGTAKILAWAWRIVFTGVGFIFTFFYVNFHGMMRYLVGSTTFCKFGAEWQIGGVKTKKENVMLEFAEIIVILFCDFIVFIVLSIIITFICMGFYYVKFENWFDAIKDISKTLFSIFKDFLKF